MDGKHVEWRKHQNIRPIKLPNKEKHYMDLLNVESSLSGRIDILKFCNTFIMEAGQMIVNAIELFEDGYFDGAYYSLRSAIEISTTLIFLSDMPETERNKYVVAWNENKHFPMQGQMIKELTTKGDIFADMLCKMPKFFDHVKNIISKLNKYVHKQGLQHFYVLQNYHTNVEIQEEFIYNFEYHLKKCIGIVAVMRLAIDPLPVLLMDEEILFRSPDLITEPYSEIFVEEYIGEDVLESYKSTNLYSGFYNTFILQKKKPPAVFYVTNDQYIDTSQMKILQDNLSLMTEPDICAVLIVSACIKITRIHLLDGIFTYSTDRKSKRTIFSIETEDFMRFSKAENKFNQQYEEVFISVFIIGNEPYFAEHNELLNLDDIERIRMTLGSDLHI